MIKNHLSRLLGERRMSVRRLHLETGIAYGTLHLLYHGRATRFDVGTLSAICKHLDIHLDELLEYVPD